MPERWILSLMEAMAASSSLVGIEPQLHAGEALGFDEFEVGIRVLAEDAEARLPIGV